MYVYKVQYRIPVAMLYNFSEESIIQTDMQTQNDVATNCKVPMSGTNFNGDAAEDLSPKGNICYLIGKHYNM